ncbi:MAG: hypothetical protein AMXMBFR7_16880 [Planctomycetota bacterium]
MHSLKSGCAVLAAACCIACAGAEPVPGFDPERVRNAQQEIARRFQAAFESGDFRAAESYARQAIALQPDLAVPYCALARARARMGQPAAALEALAQAAARGFDDPYALRHDPHFAALREDARFAEVLKTVRASEERRGEPAPAAVRIDGVRTQEHFPEGGLRVRLHLHPDAAPGKPQRLVIWLHPTGESMVERIEAFAPMLAKYNLALLVPVQLDWTQGWNGEDLARLFERTLPALAEVRGVDITRPILWGHSAGGQAALALWSDAAGPYGALIVSAARPADMRIWHAKGEIAPLAPPAEPHRGTPIYVLVGETDDCAPLWADVLPAWKRAYVPVEFTQVSGRGHEWLFDGARLEAFERWLGAAAKRIRMPTAADAPLPEGEEPKLMPSPGLPSPERPY